MFMETAEEVDVSFINPDFLSINALNNSTDYSPEQIQIWEKAEELGLIGGVPLETLIEILFSALRPYKRKRSYWWHTKTLEEQEAIERSNSLSQEGGHHLEEIFMELIPGFDSYIPKEVKKFYDKSTNKSELSYKELKRRS